jgi:uncharacterized membrane protein/nitrite reductase/ring-hydroxylating ferredoxin subunit
MRARAQIKSHPIHPMLVAFPIGLWVAGFAMDLIGFGVGDASIYVAGWYAILGGCCAAVLAAIAGAVDLFGVVPTRSSARTRGYLHASLNLIALALFATTLALRGGPGVPPYWLSLLLSGIGVVVIGISGWLGGTLVYRNQIGVDHRYANAGKYRDRELKGWDEPVCNQGELAYGQVLIARVGAERIVVAHCDDGYVAFSDHCTHRGGPLSDGAVIGCVVQCPWHGSQFDLHTGRVVAGPAQDKIETYQVAIRNGEVFVSPHAAKLEQPLNPDASAA